MARRAPARRRPPAAAVKRALDLLGPLEGRIMRVVWNGLVPEACVVRDVQDHMSELAYTTVMTTLNRLVQKGLLEAERVRGERAHRYREAETPQEFLDRVGRSEVQELIDRFGDVALAAFATELDSLSVGQRERLRRAAGR